MSSIVFIEDIDLVGQNRWSSDTGQVLPCFAAEHNGWNRGEEEYYNHSHHKLPGDIDKALSQRPARFDLVINVALPALNSAGS